jgi:ethanolamine ammonia-lyase small subunit
VYLTWAPRVGRTDAERNCISNVRPEGLRYAAAALRLAYLLGEARRLKLSGVGLKDDSEGEGKASERRLAKDD